VIGAQLLEIAGDAVDLAVEVIDHPHRDLHVGAPGLGDRSALQQLFSAGPEEVRHRAGHAVGKQGGVDAVLEAGAVVHQVKPPARPLALGSHPRVRQPDRRHQITPRELGQDPGVDAVGLAGKGCEALDLLGVGDLDLEAVALELVVEEASAVHRLHGGLDRLAVGEKTLGQALETTCVRRQGALVDQLAVSGEGVEVDSLAAEV
jgi:hypothetical protein